MTCPQPSSTALQRPSECCASSTSRPASLGSNAAPPSEIYSGGSINADKLAWTRQATKLHCIELLCRKNNHPGVNVGAHALANQVLAIIEEAAHV